MNPPLVSVICLCYNHVNFVAEALASVKMQSHGNVQLIIVDDCSTDGSVEVIKSISAGDQSIEFIALPQNIGNCAAFNAGFAKAKGEFIIDLAADDVLLPDRIATGIQVLQSSGKEFGVNFTDATLIDEKGKDLCLHSDRYPHKTIPQGNVYLDIISRYFICSPSMMICREVLDEMHGYDETLAYEDFDFWVRSSRNYKYVYTPEPLVKKRILDSSLGRRQHEWGSRQLASTFRVCEKIRSLNRSDTENKALKKRILYELRRALQSGAFRIAGKYWDLWKSV